jgi:ECF sigma factor
MGYTFAQMGSYQPESHASNQHITSELEQLGAAFISELRSRSRTDRQIFESLHQDLRRLARAKMRRERPDHTLQATALVNEVFLKLFRTPLPSDFWDDPARAVRFIANAMEQILNRGIVKLRRPLADLANEHQYTNLSGIPISSGYHQPCCLALSPILPELPRC